MPSGTLPSLWLQAPELCSWWVLHRELEGIVLLKLDTIIRIKCVMLGEAWECYIIFPHPKKKKKGLLTVPKAFFFVHIAQMFCAGISTFLSWRQLFLLIFFFKWDVLK